MSKFLKSRYTALEVYTPGEQPQDMVYTKLNTNESPFPPSPSVADAVRDEADRLMLYSDPESARLTAKLAEHYGVTPSQVIMTNGSDEVLNFAFMAFSDEEHPIAFPEITYGFYPVFAELNRIPYERIPLLEDFRINYRDYIGIGKNIVIANPNAPTGIALPLDEIEEIIRSNPNNVVVIDEAYVDFGGESAVSLVDKYDNLLVTGTFSKSRSLAGARLGFGIGSPDIIRDLNTIKYSTNPYNVNRMTAVAGYQALVDSKYYEENCKIIINNREYTKHALRERGFRVLDSKANFLFAESPDISGEELYLALKSRGVLIRHFKTPIIANFNRITVGTIEEMNILLDRIDCILKEKKI